MLTRFSRVSELKISKCSLFKIPVCTDFKVDIKSTSWLFIGIVSILALKQLLLHFIEHCFRNSRRCFGLSQYGLYFHHPQKFCSLFLHTCRFPSNAPSSRLSWHYPRFPNTAPGFPTLSQGPQHYPRIPNTAPGSPTLPQGPQHYPRVPNTTSGSPILPQGPRYCSRGPNTTPGALTLPQCWCDLKSSVAEHPLNEFTLANFCPYLYKHF